MRTVAVIFYALLISSFFFMGCGGNRVLTPQTLTRGDAVKLYLTDGAIDHGIIIRQEQNTIDFVSETDHKSRSIKTENIRRVERSENIFDYQAYPISKAEIIRNKNNHNTWGYAVGGAIIGAAAGIAIALPLWYAEVDDIPPYFWAGAGAVIGSIYFAFKGQDKDRREAIARIRYLRISDQKLKNEIEAEKKKLEEIEQEKSKLKEQIKNKND